MNPKTIGHLAKAAEHLDHAANAYRGASKAHAAGNHHLAASHALAGHGHQLHAARHTEEAHQQIADDANEQGQ
ncbi:MAG: hypothetical protein JO251_03375 [Verrucomicrobia bacterium]|nr:hypothetical protein [Verrucomicrobiota bacterium]